MPPARHIGSGAGLGGRRLRLSADRAVLAAGPAHDRYYPGWQGLGLKHPRAGLVATLFARNDDVVVYLERGASLPDPLGLLGGHERLKRTRTITFRPAVPTPGADALITYLDLAVDHVHAERGQPEGRP